MFSFVKNIRFYSTSLVHDLKASFVPEGIRPFLSERFVKNGIRVDHPLITDYKHTTRMHTVIAQGTSVSSCSNPAILVDNDFNMVGNNKAQYIKVPVGKTSLHDFQLSEIKQSHEFIEQNRDKILDIVKSKNPGLLNDEQSDSDVD